MVNGTPTRLVAAVFGVALFMFTGCTSRSEADATQTDANRSPAPSAPLQEKKSEAALAEREKIDLLLASLEQSNATFIRNGTAYSGEDAADHLRRKLRAAAATITAEEFIETLASRSSVSGQQYKVRTNDGVATPSATWLRARLTEIEKTAVRQTSAIQQTAPADKSRVPATEVGYPNTPDGVLQRIRESNLTFLITESDEVERHSGRSLASRIEWKYRLSGRPEMNAANFIATYCTRSSLHGTSYEVITDKGRVPVKDWLTAIQPPPSPPADR